MVSPTQSTFSPRLIRLALLFIILVELISFLGYFYPCLTTVVFFLIIILTLVFALINLEYGLYIFLVELFIGSKGYLFHFDFAGISISLRLAIFLILIGVWLFRLIQGQVKLNFIHSKLFTVYCLLFAVLTWGVIRGLISKNFFDNLFFDANGWLYFASVFVFYDLIISWRVVKNILNLFLAAVSFLAVKTIILFYLFSHQIEWLIGPIYRWIRLNGLGEITQLSPFFSRIFFQSQIYLLIGFLLISVFWLLRKPEQFTRRNMLQPVLYLACLLVALLVSFSRSYWLGLAVGLIGLFFILRLHYFSWQKIFATAGLILLIFVFAFDFIYLLVIFPSGTGLTDFSGLISQRFGLTEEPAALSRWQQLGPLWQAIKQRPFFGTGFGTIVTYQSQDPRVITKYGGQFSTYAFEWGYLDIILKIGVLGMAVYLVLIYQIFREGIKKLKISTQGGSALGGKNEKLKMQDIEFNRRSLIMGLILGLFALLVTNITSPYLNHPLGIGYLVLCSVIFPNLSARQL